MNLIALGLITLAFVATGSRSTSNIKSKQTKSIFNIALYDSYGVSEVSFNAAKTLLESQSNIKLITITAKDIRNGKLNNQDIVVFMGGSGSQQGKDLQKKGRDIIRNFVKNGGNYIGVCGGSYLALQGSEEFNKLAIVAGKSYGDYWQRGVGDSILNTNSGSDIVLHYENGPVFDRLNVQGIKPFVTLATFESDFYIPNKGTLEGEMPGRPAIIISQYGKGKILLFSPNPIIGNDEVYHPELVLNGIKWLANNNSASNNLKFNQIFG